MPDGNRGGIRVLCVGTLYPPHNGGYELLWQAAVEHLRARGHRVAVLTTDLLPPGATAAPFEPDIHRELRSYWRDHEWPETTPRERLALERHNARTFERHVEALCPHVVAWWSMGAISQGLIERARRLRLAGVGFVIDDWMVYAQRTDQWVRAWSNRPALARAAALLTRLPTRFAYGSAGRWTFCSEVTRARALEEAGPLPDTGILRPGVDPVFARAVPAQAWRGRLLYAGRVDPRKGINTAVDALTHLPAQTTLHIVGGGEARYAEQLRHRVAGLGLSDRVSFEEACDRGALADRYAAADATLFPVEWLEPFGLVPLEAMAVGTPVVATGRGGSGEYLRDGENALLFEAGDARAMAQAVERLAGDADLRERLRSGGLRTASELSEQAWLDGVERELLAAAPV